jgi:hypothetical protein
MEVFARSFAVLRVILGSTPFLLESVGTDDVSTADIEAVQTPRHR